jgi:GNAT superfamily N-acetyltransferase
VVQRTTDHAEAVAWTQDVAGYPNVGQIWVPSNGFVQAVRRLGSVALTRDDGHRFGICLGPEPLIDSSWERIALPRNLPTSRTEGLELLGQWDVYSASTTFAPTAVTCEPVFEFEEIQDFLRLHAPGSSTMPDSTEAELWFGRYEGSRLVAIATIVRWESGAHLLSSVAVHREHRGRGLGRQLARDALFIARQNGIPHLSLAVDADNAAAISAYRAAGFHCIGQYASYRPAPPPPVVGSLADIPPPP